MIIDLEASIPQTEAASGSLVTPRMTVEVDGGGWEYGTYLTWTGYKGCYSRYYHMWRAHGSSVQLDDLSDRSDVNKGEWADARVVGSKFGTCYAYYHLN